MKGMKTDESVYVFALSLSPGSGPSLFMVLSREDAVVGWRALMGSTNPEEAAQQDPNWSVTKSISSDVNGSILHVMVQRIAKCVALEISFWVCHAVGCKKVPLN